MNIALIIAGGRGMRMGQEIPKQFLTVNDKPVIAYTMEAFQKHPDVGVIAVVCVSGWESVLSAYARQYGITKRPAKVKVRAQNRKGEFFEIEGEELLATACCHELDHLDGILFKTHVIRMLDPEELEKNG